MHHHLLKDEPTISHHTRRQHTNREDNAGPACVLHELAPVPPTMRAKSKPRSRQGAPATSAMGCQQRPRPLRPRASLPLRRPQPQFSPAARTRGSPLLWWLPDSVLALAAAVRATCGCPLRQHRRPARRRMAAAPAPIPVATLAEADQGFARPKALLQVGCELSPPRCRCCSWNPRAAAAEVASAAHKCPVQYPGCRRSQ